MTHFLQRNSGRQKVQSVDMLPCHDFPIEARQSTYSVRENLQATRPRLIANPCQRNAGVGFCWTKSHKDVVASGIPARRRDVHVCLAHIVSDISQIAHAGQWFGLLFTKVEAGPSRCTGLGVQRSGVWRSLPGRLVEQKLSN